MSEGRGEKLIIVANRNEIVAGIFTSNPGCENNAHPTQFEATSTRNLLQQQWKGWKRDTDCWESWDCSHPLTKLHWYRNHPYSNQVGHRTPNFPIRLHIETSPQKQCKKLPVCMQLWHWPARIRRCRINNGLTKGTGILASMQAMSFDLWVLATGNTESHESWQAGLHVIQSSQISERSVGPKLFKFTKSGHWTQIFRFEVWNVLWVVFWKL